MKTNELIMTIGRLAYQVETLKAKIEKLESSEQQMTRWWLQEKQKREDLEKQLADIKETQAA